MKTETVNYYEVKTDSASSLKTFDDDRRKYYKKYVLGEQVEDKYNHAIFIGKLVDCLLLEPDEFDNRFYMSTCDKVPTELMLAFVEALYSCSVNMPEAGFEAISRAAHSISGYKISYEQVIKKFAGSEAEDYYNQIKAVRGKNMEVVTIQDRTTAERIVAELKTNFVTSHIINLESDDRFQVINQFQVLDYEIDDWKFKSMMDKVIVDHVEKTVQIYDLKCTWTVENFYSEYYLYRKTYIQAYVYFRAWELIVEDPISPFYGYEVFPPKFIVCDSTNYMNPLVYELTLDDVIEGYKGFEYRGRHFNGVRDIITNLKFAINNNLWNISRKNYESKGVCHIKG